MSERKSIRKSLNKISFELNGTEIDGGDIDKKRENNTENKE